MRAEFVVVAACAMLTACGGSASGNGTVPASGASEPSAKELSPVDYAIWRDVGAGTNRASLTMMCAGSLAGLEAADPSLKDKVALQLPWSVQVSKHGKLQAQCVWTGPDQRKGRIVVDVLCRNDDNDRCSRFAYATEGSRRLDPVAVHHHPPPPLSSAFPPGHDDVERSRSQAILAWARENAPDRMGALRVEFRATKVGIDGTAKIPVLCGQVRAQGKGWHRFAVYSLGAAAGPPSPTFFWLREPDDKAIHDFCDGAGEDFQWYSLPDSAMNEG